MNAVATSRLRWACPYSRRKNMPVRQFRRRLFRVAAVSLLSVLIAAVSPAYAADCSTLVSDLDAYLKAKPLNRVDAVVTTNQSDRGFASVTLYLSLVSEDKLLFARGGTQFFSDRGNPSFSAKETDKQGIRIYKGSPVRVELVLESWNDGVLSGVPACEGNVMFGSFNSGNGAFSVSFKKGQSIP